MEEIIKKSCEGCNTLFDIKFFLKHVTKSKKCKNVYGEERFSILKKEMRSAANKRYKKNANTKYMESLVNDGTITQKDHETGFVKVCEGCSA